MRDHDAASTGPSRGPRSTTISIPHDTAPRDWVLAGRLMIAANYVVINYSLSQLAVALEARRRRLPDPGVPGAARSAAEAA